MVIEQHGSVPKFFMLALITKTLKRKYTKQYQVCTWETALLNWLPFLSPPRQSRRIAGSERKDSKVTVTPGGVLPWKRSVTAPKQITHSVPFPFIVIPTSEEGAGTGVINSFLKY